MARRLTYIVWCENEKTGHTASKGFSKYNDAVNYSVAMKKRGYIVRIDKNVSEVKTARKRNPVPPSKHLQQIEQAARLFTKFTGHEAEEVGTVDRPVIPDVLVAVGTVDGIMYTTVRDGVTEKYVHRFKTKARPLFAVSPDGKQLFMLGGAYDFTERGIVDAVK